MKIQIGQQAPGFALYSGDKKQVSLDSYRGKNVLLLFFPLAFSSVCTKELCSVRDNISVYNSSGADVIGISVDSLYVLKRFREDQGLNFELLSDFNKDTSAAYDSLYAEFGYDMKGVSKRAAFVIDRNGIIRYAEVLENPGLVPDFEAINSILATLA